MRLGFLLCCLLFITPAWAAEEKASGLPVPRFASLKSAETNLRTGPGTRYPISWVFKRASWPVEIVEEFEQWRKITDNEGTSGWVHKHMLSGKRHALIRAPEPQLLHREPAENAPPVLRVEPMVHAAVLECQPDWCRLEIAQRKGWIRKQALWGVYGGEVF